MVLEVILKGKPVCVWLRLSEDKNKERFVEMPLCMIRLKYKNVPGGDKFVENLISSSLPWGNPIHLMSRFHNPTK